MKRIFLLSLAAALGLCAGACQKEPSDAERKAEIERQVQERVAAEHQAEEQQKMAQREADLNAREQALSEREDRATTTASPTATVAPAAQTRSETAESETGSYATFYRKLDPYGDWIETGDYGFVFQPRPAAQSNDWRPYTNGHWVYTDAGWTWISEEPFGWATYHYGRWIRLRNVGWLWVPGEQWAPAWVSWRKGSDYVGWAPLPPEAHFDRQTGIRNWADNYYDIGPEQYSFVPANEFGRKLSPREIVPLERNVTIINQTTNVTNIVYNNSIVVDRGPSYDELRARSHQPIERFRLERTQNLDQDRPIIRGQVVALFTVDFHPAERAARPNRVVRTIPQPEVERGWNGIGDPQAAAKAREKMRAEATPPPNLPPKQFVRPKPTKAVPPSSAPVQIAPPASTPAPAAASAVSTTPRSLPRPRPLSPQPSLPVSAKTTPNESPSAPPGPSRPTRPPTTTATPGELVQPTPVENISPKEADHNRREKGRPAREEKRRERQEERAQRQTEREQKILERRERNAGQPAKSATPEPSKNGTAPSPPPGAATTAMPASAAENVPNENQSQPARERGKNRKPRGNKPAAPSPSASPATP